MGSSQVQQLKQSLAAFGQATDQASQTLLQQGKEYDRAAQQLLALIGGSATGKDREVATAIQSASHAVKEASRALHRASSTARSYGSSI